MNYNNAISIASGFKIGAALPLDDRVVFNQLSEVAYLTDNNLAYDGMIVSVIGNAEGDDIGVYYYFGYENTWCKLANQDWAEKTFLKKTDATTVFRYKGSKATISELPSTGNTIGDVWNVGSSLDGANYVWNGSAWDRLGAAVDLTPYQLKADAVGKKGTGTGAEIFNGHQFNEATGAYSHAEGANTHAQADHAHTEGHSTYATAEDAHAEGRDSRAEGTAAHAEGWVAKATGNFSHAEGHTTQAIGETSHAEGRETIAFGLESHAEGRQTKANGEFSHAGGWRAEANGNYSFAQGIRSKAEGKNTYAIGADTYANGDHAIAIGNETIALGNESIADGYATLATGQIAHASGSLTVAEGVASWALGEGIAADDKVYTMKIYHGTDTNAFALNENHDFAEGDYLLITSADKSRTAIIKVTAVDDSRNIETNVDLDYIWQPELINNSTPDQLPTVRKFNPTLSRGRGAVATGCGNIAQGDYSYVGGVDCQSGIPTSGVWIPTENCWTRNREGNFVCLEGSIPLEIETRIKITGTGRSGTTYEGLSFVYEYIITGSMKNGDVYTYQLDRDSDYLIPGLVNAEALEYNHIIYIFESGSDNAASASFSHGIGLYSTATAQAVFGSYNATNKNALFIIGNGTESSRNNAFEVTKDGKAYLGGDEVLTTKSQIELTFATTQDVEDLFS